MQRLARDRLCGLAGDLAKYLRFRGAVGRHRILRLVLGVADRAAILAGGGAHPFFDVCGRARRAGLLRCFVTVLAITTLSQSTRAICSAFSRTLRTLSGELAELLTGLGRSAGRRR